MASIKRSRSAGLLRFLVVMAIGPITASNAAADCAFTNGVVYANECTASGNGGDKIVAATGKMNGQSGTIDATNLTPPFNFRAQESGLRELVAFVKEDYLTEPAGAIVVRENLFQSDPLLMEKFIRGTLKGLLYVRQNRAGTTPILARLMKIQEEMAAKIYDLVLPGLTMDGTINAELQKKVLEFVFKVQGIKEPAVAEKIYDFAPVRKIRVDLDARKWKPLP